MTERIGRASALECLVSEHRLLSRLIEALSGYAAQLEVDSRCGPADLLGFTEILEGLADLGHHFKEEEFVLPELVRHGLAWQAESIVRIQRDHEQSRYLIDVLVQAATQQDIWSDEDRRQVIATIRSLVTLELAHIAFENMHLLPAITERLGEGDLSALGERFDASDERFGREKYARLAELAEVLIGRYGTAR